MRYQWIPYLIELARSGITLEVFLPSLHAFSDRASEELETTDRDADSVDDWSQLPANHTMHMIVRANVRLFDVPVHQPVHMLHLWCKRGALKAAGHLEYDAARALFGNLRLPPRAVLEVWRQQPTLWHTLTSHEIDHLAATVAELPSVALCRSPFIWRLLCSIGLAAWMYLSRCPRYSWYYTGRDSQTMFFEVAMLLLRNSRLPPTTDPVPLAMEPPPSPTPPVSPANVITEPPVSPAESPTSPTSPPSIAVESVTTNEADHMATLRAYSPPPPSPSSPQSSTDADDVSPEIIHSPARRKSLSRQLADASRSMQSTAILDRLRPSPYRSAQARRIASKPRPSPEY